MNKDEIEKWFEKEHKHTTSLDGYLGNYVLNQVLPELVNCFRNDYHPKCLNDIEPNPDHFSVMHALTCSILLAFEIEALANKIFYDLGAKGTSPADDLTSLIKAKIPDFPAKHFSQAIKEIFIVRDAIAHGHLYEVFIKYPKKMRPGIVSYRQEIPQHLALKFGDKKYREYVNQNTKRTKLIDLNVNPVRISIVDVFTILLMVNVTNELLFKALGERQTIYSAIYKVKLMSNRWDPTERKRSIIETDAYAINFSAALAHLFRRLGNNYFKKEIVRHIRGLKKVYYPYLPHPSKEKKGRGMTLTFFDNLCPRCHTYGFQTPIYYFGKCKNCGYLDARETNEGTGIGFPFEPPIAGEKYIILE
jgi:hypothetical protein